jgi:hypothetical protein
VLANRGGQSAADRLKRQAPERGPERRQRRIVVKARIVGHKFGSGASGAHLRYLQRDGTTRDGERGRLYGPERDLEDGPAFVERGEGDRHSFRLIVAMTDTVDRMYRPSEHLAAVRDTHVVREGHEEGFVEAHIRRLEALRRAGIVERVDATGDREGAGPPSLGPHAGRRYLLGARPSARARY